MGPWFRESKGWRKQCDISACLCLLLICTPPPHLDISKASFMADSGVFTPLAQQSCTFLLFLYICSLWSKPVLLFVFCIRGSPSLAISAGFSLSPPLLLSFLFLGELFFISQSIIYHLYFFWHMRILNLSLLFVFFLPVVGPHSPRPISCVFSDADVCDEREHLGAPQRKQQFYHNQSYNVKWFRAKK